MPSMEKVGVRLVWGKTSHFHTSSKSPLKGLTGGKDHMDIGTWKPDQRKDDFAIKELCSVKRQNDPNLFDLDRSKVILREKQEEINGLSTKRDSKAIKDSHFATEMFKYMELSLEDIWDFTFLWMKGKTAFKVPFYAHCCIDYMRNFEIL